MMWPHYYNQSAVNPYWNWNRMYPYPGYVQHPNYDYQRSYPYYHSYAYDNHRQKAVRGQATWTEGGQVTKCGIPWSKNEYMTVAVSTKSRYKCGQTLKIRNLSSPVGREIIVTVVDHVAGYPPNKINLHRNAFEALGSSPSVGVIDIEINPSPELEEEKWGKYLLEVTESAYPSYNVTDYNFVQKTEVSPTQTREVYEFILQSPQDNIKIQGNVIYNPRTDRVISIDIKEIEHFRSY